jgi:bifunctional non-homologous end joining protein LigD
MRMTEGKPPGTVVITNADKVWWPDDGLTKADIARHYARVAPRLLPWTTDRPLTVERCPDGMLGHCFYQKDFSAYRKFGIATAEIYAASAGRMVHYAMAADAVTLLGLVNLGGLSLHLMNCRASDVEHPDWLAFDLDPVERFADAVRAALVLRGILGELGLRGYPKTTGGKGLHVLVPLRAGATQDAVSRFAHAVAEAMVRAEPDAMTLAFSKRERGNRLYVDVRRNAFGATIVAPYSVRRRPHAPVSTPLAWDEVHAELRPWTFNVRTIPERLAGPDPWRRFWSDRQALPELTPDVPRPRARSGARVRSRGRAVPRAGDRARARAAG